MKGLLPALLLGLLFGLFGGHAALGEVAPDQAVWMGSYLNQTKVGYSLVARDERAQALAASFSLPARPDLNSGTQGLIFSAAELEVKAYGRHNRVRWTTLARIDPEWKLKSILFALNSSEADFTLRGTVHRDWMDLELESSGDTRTDRLALPPQGALLAECLPHLLARKLAGGEVLDGTYTVFEPHQMALTSWRVNLEGIEKWKVAGKEIPVYRICQNVGGLATMTWIDSLGNLLKEFAPLGPEVGYVSYRETADQAVDRGYVHPLVLSGSAEQAPEPDLLHSSSVPVSTRLSKPDRVKKMVIDLWDFQLDRPFPFSARQSNLSRIESSAFTQQQPLRLSIRSATPPVDSKPWTPAILTDPRYAPFLRPESLIQSDHPEIQEKAQTLVAGLSTPWEKAQALHAWVTANVETEFRITLPSALEVLHSLKGDCNEQSVLLAGLARAAGIPAKICTGLVYQSGAFYYHAWNEVLVSAEPVLWIPMDAALDQTIADATHIKFADGGLSEQTYINGLIGKIQARILETETDDRVP